MGVVHLRSFGARKKLDMNYIVRPSHTNNVIVIKERF
jgi:hypothetical protein